MNKIWEFLKQKNYLIIAVVILVMLVLSLVIYFQHNSIVKLKDKYTTEVNYKNALIDSIHYYKNKNNEVVAEKLTLQENIKFLQTNNADLSSSQKELIKRVTEIQKTSYTIAAALIQTKVSLDSLRSNKVQINSKDTSVTFSDSTKNLKYDIKVKYVIPIGLIKPEMKFNTFELPNKQFVDFFWKDNKKEGYPVAFSVSNSNDYFKTVNIESYAIPELKKVVVKPTGWQKIGNWFKSTGNTVMKVTVGAVAGAGILYLLTH